MRNDKRTLLQRLLRIQPNKPTVFTLLAHVIESVFTGGILLILLPGCAIIAFFYYNGFSIENLLVLLIGTITVVAFYRGCVAWQQDLDEYRRRKSGMRHSHQGRL
jgi:hypothetical protein